MRLQNKLITKAMPWHANMTELNHLGAALLAKPHIFESRMTQLFSASRYSDNPLTFMLSGKSEKTIGTSAWEWEMRGATTRPLVIVENVLPAANTTPGRFKEPF